MLLFLVPTWALRVCLFLSPETPSWSPWTCLVALVTVLAGLRSGMVEPRKCSGCGETCWGVEFSRGGFFGGVCCSCESEGDGRPSASPEGDGSVVFCEVWSSEVVRFNKPFDSSEMEKKWNVVNESQRNYLMKPPVQWSLNEPHLKDWPAMLFSTRLDFLLNSTASLHNGSRKKCW